VFGIEITDLDDYSVTKNRRQVGLLACLLACLLAWSSDESRRLPGRSSPTSGPDNRSDCTPTRGIARERRASGLASRRSSTLSLAMHDTSERREYELSRPPPGRGVGLPLRFSSAARVVTGRTVVGCSSRRQQRGFPAGSRN
jgi:hypothetical protein